jgi:hypothetical protein
MVDSKRSEVLRVGRYGLQCYLAVAFAPIPENRFRRNPDDAKLIQPLEPVGGLFDQKQVFVADPGGDQRLVGDLDRKMRLD